METSDKHVSNPVKRQPWNSPNLRMVGTIGEVLGEGGGKLSLEGGDPGESRKQQPDAG